MGTLVGPSAFVRDLAKFALVVIGTVGRRGNIPQGILGSRCAVRALALSSYDSHGVGVVQLRSGPPRRAKVIVPTPEGRDLALRAVKVVEAADQEFFSRLGGETNHFIQLMRQLRA